MINFSRINKGVMVVPVNCDDASANIIWDVWWLVVVSRVNKGKIWECIRNRKLGIVVETSGFWSHFLKRIYKCAVQKCMLVYLAWSYVERFLRVSWYMWVFQCYFNIISKKSRQVLLGLVVERSLQMCLWPTGESVWTRDTTVWWEIPNDGQATLWSNLTVLGFRKGHLETTTRELCCLWSISSRSPRE